jgi:hypothetical protein
MVVSQTPLPMAKVLAQGCQDAQAGIEFDAVALAIVKADGLHMRKVLSAQARQVVESCPPEKSTRA